MSITAGRTVPVGDGHPDDEFHPPTSDDPYWSETCWFAFSIPERRLSGQLYPFFQANQSTAAGGAFVWDDHGHQPWNCRYAKNFWHLPFPSTPLTDLTLANGIRYRCREPQRVFEIAYDDPDGGDEVHMVLTFEAIAPVHYLGGRHLDQPGHFSGTLTLAGEVIEVDSFGFRDRSWGPRSQFGRGRPNGYSYGSASEAHGFHLMAVDRGEGYVGYYGHVLRDGEWSNATGGRRTVLERDPSTNCPTQVVIEVTDELGRTLVAEGEIQNRIGLHLNPNLFTWMCLTRWEFDGVEGWGEDHDNWDSAGPRLPFAGRP